MWRKQKAPHVVVSSFIIRSSRHLRLGSRRPLFILFENRWMKDTFWNDTIYSNPGIVASRLTSSRGSVRTMRVTRHKLYFDVFDFGKNDRDRECTPAARGCMQNVVSKRLQRRRILEHSIARARIVATSRDTAEDPALSSRIIASKHQGHGNCFVAFLFCFCWSYETHAHPRPPLSHSSSYSPS